MVLRHSRILICFPDITLYKISQHRLFIRYRERRLFRVVLTLQTCLAQAAHVPFFSVSRRFLAVHGYALCLPNFDHVVEVVIGCLICTAFDKESVRE